MATNAQQLARGLWTTLQQQPDQEKVITKAFLQMVDEQGLTALLPFVVRHLEYLHDAYEQEHSVQVTVAHVHKDVDIKKIAAQITGSSVKMHITEDASLIGGFVLKHQNIIYDASVATQLQAAKRALTS